MQHCWLCFTPRRPHILMLHFNVNVVVVWLFFLCSFIALAYCAFFFILFFWADSRCDWFRGGDNKISFIHSLLLCQHFIADSSGWRCDTVIMAYWLGLLWNEWIINAQPYSSLRGILLMKMANGASPNHDEIARGMFNVCCTVIFQFELWKFNDSYIKNWTKFQKPNIYSNFPKKNHLNSWFEHKYRF